MKSEEENLAWCVFRNLVHTTYREARHIGPEDDPEARLSLPKAHQFTEAAKQCSTNRRLLKGTSLFNKTATADSVDAVTGPYRNATGLDLNALVSLFRESNWARQYGGEKWAKISEATIDLENALRNEDMARATKMCAVVKEIKHNSGRLVPDRAEWESTPYLREKWPELCDWK